MSGPLLQVRDLRVELTGSGAEAVRGVSFHADRGEIVGVVGESGCGKSLTLRSIVRLLPAAARLSGGSVLLDGVDLAQLPEAGMRDVRGSRIGVVFQEPMTALNPTMRIGEQIAEGARRHLGASRRAGRERAVELLERVGISDPRGCADLYPHQLSGGMRQRAMIAIALAAEPAVVLCDEPTTALDATVTSRVLDLLGGLAADLDVAFVLVTHDLGVVARSCSRVVVMYGGTVVEEGPAGAVLRRPRHPYTLALLRAAPTRRSTLGDLRAIPGRPPAPDAAVPGCPFADRCALAEPECRQPVALAPVAGDHATACRRHDLLAVEEAVHDA